MNTRRMFFAAALACIFTSNLLAQHNDIELGYDNVANPGGFVLSPLDFEVFTQEGILLVKSNMEERDPFTPGDFSGDQPGFTTNASADLFLNSGDSIVLEVLDASVHSAFGAGYVNFYNPATGAMEATGRIALEDNTSSTPDLIINGDSIESGPNLQFIASANAGGHIHDHVVWDLLDDATAPTGAYGILFQLHSDYAPRDGVMDLSSEPFWVVFNHDLTTSEFDVALESFGVGGGGVVSVTPDSWSTVAGTHVGGGLAELAESDNLDLSFQRNTLDIASRVVVEFESTLLTESPSSLEFSFEASVFARSSVLQVIELWDFDSASWEQVDSRNATRFSDSTATVALSGDLSRFVQAGTRIVRSRVRLTSSNQRQLFALNVDHVEWVYGQ